MNDATFTHQANTLACLTKMVSGISFLLSDGAFMSGSKELVAAQVALMKVEAAWKAELENVKAET